MFGRRDELKIKIEGKGNCRSLQYAALGRRTGALRGFYVRTAGWTKRNGFLVP